MKKNSTILMSLVFGLLIASEAYGDLIVNGSFEAASVNPGPFVELWSGNTSITGWTVIGESIHYVGTAWVASEGSRSLDLDGGYTMSGGIQQTFSTTPGLQYLVSFDMAGNYAGAPTIKPMRVSADAQWQDFTFDITGRSANDMGWTPYTWSFTADDTSATLAFRSLTVISDYGPALDNVCVTTVPVPVPGAALLGVLGLGYSGWRLKRRPA